MEDTEQIPEAWKGPLAAIGLAILVTLGGWNLAISHETSGDIKGIDAQIHAMEERQAEMRTDLREHERAAAEIHRNLPRK